MANRCLLTLLKPNTLINFTWQRAQTRLFHSSPAVFSVQSGKVKISPKRNKPVTYESALSPPHIAHRKSWNSWNTSTIEGGLRPAETVIEDLFIRKFLAGTFPAQCWVLEGNCNAYKFPSRRTLNSFVLNRPNQLKYHLCFDDCTK